MIERRDVFQAIADPTRRRILERLSGGPLNIAQLLDHESISRQGLAKHLKVLQECGILVLQQRGREQICEAKLEALDEVVDWVSSSRKQWQQRFRKLDKLLATRKKN